MSDEEINQQLESIRRTQTVAILALGALVILLVISFISIMAIVLPLRDQLPGTVITASPSPSFTNTVSTSGELEAIKERATRQGYYTKAQFSELMGFSVRTLERRIEDGLLEPPATITPSGAVRIDLETVLVE